MLKADSASNHQASITLDVLSKVQQNTTEIRKQTVLPKRPSFTFCHRLFSPWYATTPARLLGIFHPPVFLRQKTYG